jgi:hypothetical protein
MTGPASTSKRERPMFKTITAIIAVASVVAAPP